MDLNEIRNSYILEGYDIFDASNKTCQDIILQSGQQHHPRRGVGYHQPRDTSCNEN